MSRKLLWNMFDKPVSMEKLFYWEFYEKKQAIKKLEEEYRAKLNTFVSSKLRETYVEPRRKNVPKGMPIGFSARKRKASLLILVKNSFEVCKELGVSYGVLRKWKTERAFKEASQNFLSEFVKWI